IIDFRELEDNRLFVISGNTGAGKTTIFDGICFALYGTASGQDRENNAMLRSDFAADDTHTSVELEFELSGKTYRILRQLGHVKQGNKTKTGEKYEFFEMDQDKEIPCVDRQIVSEIDKKVETLMGLTQDQFKQDRKSTRLNSSHVSISYAVFCVQKKKDEKKNCNRLRRS